MECQGRVLGVDHGTKRIGLALSDPLRMLAQALEVVEGEAAFFRYLGELLERKELDCIVVGLPLSMDGSVGAKAREVLEFKTRLERYLETVGGDARQGRPVVVETLDERLTSVQAESSLRRGGLSRKKRRERVDQVAAQILLQCYLDRCGNS